MSLWPFPDPSTCFIQGVTWTPNSLSFSAFPKQAKHRLIPLDVFLSLCGMCFLSFSHSKPLVFFANLTWKQASEKGSLGNTASASSKSWLHLTLNLVTSVHLSAIVTQRWYYQNLPTSNLFLAQHQREPISYLFFYFQFPLPNTVQAYGYFSITNCLRENEGMILIRLEEHIAKIKQFNPFQFINTIFCSSDYTSNFI